MKTNAQRIDVHHHVVPPEFVAHLGRRKIEWTGGAGIPKWSTSLAREAMERLGIAAAVASVQPQGYWGDTKDVVEWARHCNEFLARVVQEDRDHFGGFAMVPLPDTAAACREVEYAYDVLGLDGVNLTASYGVQYLGHPDFDELFQELERRAAVVFIHPNTLPPGGDVQQPQLPHSLVEFTFDTTRAVGSLLYSGTLERYPSIRYIVAHAGGTVPFLAWRMTFGELLSAPLRARVPKGVLTYLRQLYYETALSTSDYALAALKEFVPESQILFGSDFPMAPPPVVEAEMVGFETSKVLDDRLRAVIGQNGLQLFPRFARTMQPVGGLAL